MQRVSAFLPSWDKRSSNSSAPKHHSSGGFIFNWAARNSISISNGTNTTPGPSRPGQSAAKSLARINISAANGHKVQREAFWPSSLDMESLKAARILKSFCFDGFLAPIQGDTEPVSPRTTQTSTSTTISIAEPQSPVSVMRKIPKRIIQNAAGIAIFTCMRSGLWMTGSGGSGILIARKSDGTWSPPSSIMLHTPTLSFIIGVDIYDCVLVVTNLAALEAITQPRVTLGEDVSLNNGPLTTTLDSDDVAIDWKTLDNTILAYMKARGRYQSVNLQGCILTERANENERFYGAEATQIDILAGNVARHVEETRHLFEVIKLAEGRTDYDKAVVELTNVESTPSDAIIASPRSTASSPRPAFGIVKADDPDPFGILALEMAGLEIREAGSRLRPSSSQFDIISNPRSPSFSRFDRQSMDTSMSKSNRASVRSLNTIRSQMTDAGTQTDVGKADTAETTPSIGQSEDGCERVSVDHISKLNGIVADGDHDTGDLAPLENSSRARHSIASLHPERPVIPPRNRPTSSASAIQVDKADSPVETPSTEEEDELDTDTNDADDEDDLDISDEEPVIIEAVQVQSTRTRAVASRMIHAKGSVVTIAKRVPPPLPTRSPARNSRCANGEGGARSSMALSPLRLAFSEADLRSEEEEPVQVTSAERSSGVLQTSKSVDLGQTHVRDAIRNFDNAEREVSPQPRPLHMVVRAAPSIDAALQADDVPEAPMTESAAPEQQTAAEVSNELASNLKMSPPDDDKTEHVHMEQTASEYESMEDGHTEDEVALKVLSAPVEQAASEYESMEDGHTEDEVALKVLPAPMDASDSTVTTREKHTSSTYTRLTEDRWSMDRSSLTTPTSERPLSVAEYTTEEDTPRRNIPEDEIEVDDQIIANKAVHEPIKSHLQTPIRSA
ncbi:hypothetical protein E4U56_007485 [Claviceps arundinis]|uniref:Ysc84 actin-binding domain-containing protein n=1 Tax=Claviceps arundinis TaxID=1623583 RepID=A0A9P7SR96_9HYPO|nr:hypothetical protein E4U56_007485 [Claviceps arundinis]